LVRLAVEPSGDGTYVEAVRELIERSSPGVRTVSLRLVR
jgi:hypothetical protein